MHKAIVSEITEVIEIPGADNIQIAKVLGESVIVSKGWEVGHVGILFPVDLQLSEEFCHHNNLFRDSQKNEDTEKKGFFENNRRVRAQPFMKIRSEGLFVGIDSVAYTGVDTSTLEVGYTFDSLNGKEICKKHITEKALIAAGNMNTKPAKKDYAPFFEKHVDSDHFRHYAANIPKGALLSFHAKWHGTSFRVSHTQVMKEVTGWWDRLVRKVKGAPLYYMEWDYVVGTRNVVLKTPDKVGHHGSEQFRYDVLEKLKPYMEKGMTIYGEIVGFVNGKPIMPDHDVRTLKDKKYTKKYGNTIRYSYGCKEHEFKFIIYRITYMNSEMENIDFTQHQLEKWCSDRGLPHTLEVYPKMVYDGDVDALTGIVEELTERPDVLTEDYISPEQISEGIIIRADTGKMTPSFWKSKSYAFRCMEGHCEAIGEEDIS